MAGIIDIRYIAEMLGLNWTEDDIQAVAAKTQEIADLEAVIKEIRIQERTTKASVVKTINKQPAVKAENCSFCAKGYIYTLDRQKLQAMADNEVIIDSQMMIPKAMIGCPNCGKQKDAMQHRIARMNPNERAWLYVILYQFAVVRLNLDIAREDFNAHGYWGIEMGEIELSYEQARVLQEIDTNRGRRANIVNNNEINTLIRNTKIMMGGNHVSAN